MAQFEGSCHSRPSAFISVAVPVDFRNESTGERHNRRKARWTPAKLSEGGSL